MPTRELVAIDDLHDHHPPAATRLARPRPRRAGLPGQAPIRPPTPGSIGVATWPGPGCISCASSSRWTTCLCPTVPEELVAEDSRHNVHADYQSPPFPVVRVPARAASPGRPASTSLPRCATPHSEPSMPARGGDRDHGLLSGRSTGGRQRADGLRAGWEGVFAGEEPLPFGLLTDLSRANAVREALRTAHPGEHHAQCDVWAVWRLIARPRRRGAVRAVLGRCGGARRASGTSGWSPSP